jgi:hypothetical protein
MRRSLFRKNLDVRLRFLARDLVGLGDIDRHRPAELVLGRLVAVILALSRYICMYLASIATGVKVCR